MENLHVLFTKLRTKFKLFPKDLIHNGKPLFIRDLMELPGKKAQK